MIFKNKFCKCFFKADNKFNLPHGYINIHFRSCLTESSVANMNMTSIYSMCIKNFLSEKLYPATIAGYNYKLNSMENGIILKLGGFSEKLPMIVDMITKAMTNINGAIDGSIFETFSKELKKNCYNCIINSALFNEYVEMNTFFLIFKRFIKFSKSFKGTSPQHHQPKSQILF